jgi:hypothetical protein
MATLKEILKEEVRKYAGSGRGANLLVFPLLDDEDLTYGVVSVDYPQRKEGAGVVVMARLMGDKIIIEEDTTDKPLLDALLQRGVPREQILLAYQGEIIPEELDWHLLKRDTRPV